MSKTIGRTQDFSTRFRWRIALARSTFCTVRQDRGTAAAISLVIRDLTRSFTFRLARLGRHLIYPENLVAAVLPLGNLPMQHDVLFIGYIEARLGLGESLRGLVRAFAAEGCPFALYPFNFGVETRLIGEFMKEKYDLRRRHQVNIIEMSTEQVPEMFRQVGQWKLAHSYNILRTYWELQQAPLEWKTMLRGIHEIWAPNDFVANSFRWIFQGAITVVPPCVEIDRETDFDRNYFHMDNNFFYFLFSFDYFSRPARKNPFGVLRAFQAAFADRNEKIGLVIKSTSDPHHYKEVRSAIRHAADDDPRIKVIDASFSRDEMLSLIRQSDCYVSLHRSEGFGLGMAEAMALGKPVIGTDYSGSTDFLSSSTGFPIPFKMQAVLTGEYIFSDGQCWAEPDHAQAVEAMRQVVCDQPERQRRAAAGKALVETRYGRRNVGRLAARRVSEILDGLRLSGEA